jgi:CPA1 family monovalent cation:H+ antiporter
VDLRVELARLEAAPAPAAAVAADGRGIVGRHVSLAAALSLPLDIPRRDLLVLVFLTFIVIVGTLGLQGVSLPWAIRKLGIQPPDPRRDILQQAHAMEEAVNAAIARLHELEGAEGAPPAVVQRLEPRLRACRVLRLFPRPSCRCPLPAHRSSDHALGRTG